MPAMRPVRPIAVGARPISPRLFSACLFSTCMPGAGQSGGAYRDNAGQGALDRVAWGLGTTGWGRSGA